MRERCTFRTGTNEWREGTLGGPLDLLEINFCTNRLDKPLPLYPQHYHLSEVALFHHIARKMWDEGSPSRWPVVWDLHPLRNDVLELSTDWS